MGDKDACFKIGKIYQDGCLSVHKSILWYEKAAEKGHMKAQTAVGDMYINASKTRPPYSTQYHVEFDSEKGLKWYKRAFSNGNIDVAVKIGDIYRLNDGQQAMGWYVKAYQLGVVKAGEKIGDMYAYGSGVKQDYDLAKEWYIKSYEKGHMFSAIKIAGLYFETRSDESNAIAEEWIAKAYANPDSEVAFRIANLYDYHFTEDLARSLKWYYKAGLCNHQPSQKHLLELDEYTNDLSIETKSKVPA
jgi:TPR repeat protein